MIRAVVLVALVACGSSSKPAPAAPVAKPASKCPNVADHLISLMSQTAREAPAEDVDRIRKVFADRCEQDGWSASAQACFLGLGTMAEVDRCAGELTQTQTEAFGAAIQAESKPAPDAAK